MDARILISPHWDFEFHVHIDASNLVVRVMLAQNLIKKCDQSIAYASQLLNNIKQNHTMTEKETFTMVYVFHKFCHYLLGTNSFFIWTIWCNYIWSKNLKFQEK
jgi:hypothetical protein